MSNDIGSIRKRTLSIAEEELIRRDSDALKKDMMIREIEEAKELNDAEMKKEIENTREMHMSDIACNIYF